MLLDRRIKKRETLRTIAEHEVLKAPKNAAAEMTKEQRENMAAMHEKMAGCLRSDKAMNECRTEMMGQCQAMMGGDGCPMMMDHMRGMMGPSMMKRHRAMMQNQNNTKEE